MKNLTYRHFGSDNFDIIADSYSCMIRRHGGKEFALHIHPKGERCPGLILRPDAGFTAQAGAYKLLTQMGACSEETEKLELTYANEDSVETTVGFYADRIEMVATYTGKAPVKFEQLYVGRGSRLYTEEVFTPTHQDEAAAVSHYLRPDETVVLAPGLMSPPPWCFSAKQTNARWMGFALEPTVEEMDFFSFGSHPGADREYAWKIDYSGVAVTRKAYTSPAVVFRFDLEDEFAVLDKHVKTIVETGKLVIPDRKIPRWQYGVSACGWRWQHSKKDACTQELYQNYLDTLEQFGLDCDTMIIDDFWGDPAKHGIWKTDKTRWPDMRGFTDAQHKAGRHVLLWVCAFSNGLPEEECRGGVHNIESPVWQARLREDARRLLSDAPGCYNADGVKFDFTSAMPQATENDKFRGVGFIRERFRLVYEALTAVKPDAMIVCQCMNPYFVPYQTVIRLNDYFALPEHGMEEMGTRAKVAKAIGFGIPVDTDHISFNTFSYKGGYDYYRNMDKFGTVSVYVNRDDIEDPDFCAILKEQVDRNLKRK